MFAKHTPPFTQGELIESIEYSIKNEIKQICVNRNSSKPCTWIDFYLAVVAGISWETSAVVVERTAVTSATIETAIRFTHVYEYVASNAC